MTSLADSLEAMLDAYGESMTLSRAGEGTTITLKGKALTSTREPINGSAEQWRFRVKVGAVAINASAWSTKAPRRTDSIVIAGRTHKVMTADPLKDSDAAAGYLLEVIG